MKYNGLPNKFFQGALFFVLFSIPCWVVIYLAYLKLRGNG